MANANRLRIVSRRGFLNGLGALAALGAVGAALQACQQAEPTPTPAPKPVAPAPTTAPAAASPTPAPAPKPTEAPAKPTAAAPAATVTPAPTAAAKPTTAAGPAGKKDVNLWHSWAVKQAEPLVALTNEFNGKSPDVNVVLTFVPGDQLPQKMLASIAAGNPPELNPANPNDLPTFADAGGIKDLSEYAKSGQIDTKDIYPGPLEVITYKGKIVAVPLTVGTQAYYMSEELWKAAGLDPVGKPPKTWEDLVNYSRALTKPAEKQWGWMITNDGTGSASNVWLCYLVQNGGSMLSTDLTKATFNSPEGVETMQFFVDLVNKHKVSPQTKVTSSDITQAYGTGKVGFFQANPFYLGQIREYKFTTQTAPMTKKVKAGNILGGWYFPIFVKSKNPEGGWTYLIWMFKPENQHRLNIGMGNLPTKASTANYPAYQEYVKKEPQVKAFVDQLPIASVWPPVRAMLEAPNILGQAIQEAIYMQSTPKQALDSAAQQVDALLKKEQR